MMVGPKGLTGSVGALDGFRWFGKLEKWRWLSLTETGVEISGRHVLDPG